MATRKKKPVNYLNNANLMEQIRISKRLLEEAKSKNPDVTPASCMTKELVNMLVMLIDRYSKKANWRSYCVDEKTECLTKRGWMDIDGLTTNDLILSYSEKKLCWSRIEDIHRSKFKDKMFRLTIQGMDALVTPGHRFITQDGLKKVEYLRERDRIVLLASAVDSPEQTYDNAFVELIGWVITEGSYYKDPNRNYCRIVISQNEGVNAERIRKCLKSLNAKYSECERKNDNIIFHLTKNTCKKVLSVAPDKIPTMDFILSLTQPQRELLINTMVAGDGWITYDKHLNYTQCNKEHVDIFLALCTMAGYQTSTITRPPIGFGKKPIYVIRIFSRKSKHSVVENINFHGGKNNNRIIGESKETYPNQPTVFYKGRVWCPKTEFGSFVARRNGYIYLTGNTYIEDMRGEAIVSLLNGALKFNPDVGQNPFGYLTQIVHNSFLTTLEKEKKVRKIRDDLLEQQGFNPSNTRQLENDSARLERIEREFYEDQENEENQEG